MSKTKRIEIGRVKIKGLKALNEKSCSRTTLKIKVKSDGERLPSDKLVGVNSVTKKTKKKE